MNVRIEDGTLVREVDVAEAYCLDCDEYIGESTAENVGFDVAVKHEGCDYVMRSWTVTETVNCANCADDATHLEEISFPLGDTSEVPYCDDCGYEP